MVFSKKNFVADSNEIAVSYCIGCVEFRHRESSGHGPPLLAWDPKISKNMSFLVFCEFLLIIIIIIIMFICPTVLEEPITEQK
jgi:hypothetical protein